MPHQLLQRRGILAISIASTLAISACGLTPQQEAEAIEQGILSTPGAEELWSTIKSEYPRDFDILIERIRALDAANQLNESKAKEIGAEWLREFFVQIGPDAVKAPASTIIAWSEAESALYVTLQESAVSECAAMTMGDWIFIDEEETEATKAIARRNAAMVRASAAGRDDPQTYAEPGDTEFAELGEAIAATGLDPELQAALGSDTAMAALPPDQQCAIGVAVYQGLSALPDDIEAPIAAYMLSPL